MTNLLYLREMGMNDNSITTDIKNHRVRVIENVDIVYKGTAYNMFFEFWQCDRNVYRRENKRTGKPLKKPILETVLKDRVHIDTQFEREETDRNGRKWFSSWRKCDLEEEFYKENHAYTKKDIRDIVNKYAVKKYDGVVLIEQEAAHIINTTGGFREKDIIKKRDFQTDGDFYFHVTDEWNENHKVVTAIRREWEKTKDGRKLVETATCDIDLVTGKITG